MVNGPSLLLAVVSISVMCVSGFHNPNQHMRMQMKTQRGDNQRPPSLDELLAGNKPMHDTHPESHLKTRRLNKKMAAGLKVEHNGKIVKPKHSGVHQDYSFLEHHEDQAILHAKPMRIHGFDMDDPKVPFAGTLSDYDTRKLYDAWRQMDHATESEQTGKHEIALKHYLNAKKIYEELDGTWSQEYAKLMHYLAGAYYRSGKPKESMATLKVGMEFYEKNDLEEDEEYEAMEDEMDAMLAKMGKAGDL
jgi:hypothetical protein